MTHIKHGYDFGSRLKGAQGSGRGSAADLVPAQSDKVRAGSKQRLDSSQAPVELFGFEFVTGGSIRNSRIS